MLDRSHSLPSPEASSRRPYDLAVFLLLAIFTVVLYGRAALTVGVLSDGWVLLEIGSRGVREAPFVLLSYHTIPVTNLFMAVLWKLFGLHQLRYQAANLAEMTLVGWLLYRIGCTLFRQSRVALLASLLFLANSSFYEIPFWPTVGNFQSLAAMLYLGGVLAVMRAFRSPRSWPWLLLFSLCAVAAFFTYEPAVSVLGVGMLYAALVPPTAGEGLALGERLRRAATVILLSLPAVAVILGSKLYTSRKGYPAIFLPQDWAGMKFRIYLLVRGCVAIFTLHGSDSRIYRILSLGLTPAGGSAAYRALLAAWVLGLAAAAVLVIWRTRSPAVRFVALWFAAHMLTVATATDIVSRHFYLGALPASLLLAWWIWSAADRFAAWLARREGFAALGMPEGVAGAILAGLALTVLVAGSAVDLAAATVVHRQASAASRQVVDLVLQRLARDPTTTPKVVLVNMPAALAQDGIGAFVFINGLREVLKLSTQGRVVEPELYYTYAAFADGKFANASRPISLSDLGRRVQDPGSLVLELDGRTRTIAELTPATWRLPERYDAETAPYLEWQPGAWPWFRALAGQPLELPLAVSPERSWVAVRYLRSPGVAFTIADGSGPRFEVVRTPRGMASAWPVSLFPVDATTGTADLTLRSASEVWLARIEAFAPPTAYTPESSPFLAWTAGASPLILVDAPILLPLATPGCEASPCALQIDYLAERRRGFSLQVEAAGPPRELGDADLPEWRSEQIPLPSSRSARVRIDPHGSAPVLVRRLGWALLAARR
jgi:hypothetical protein